MNRLITTTKAKVFEQSFKDKYSYPKLEALEVDVKYAITINFATHKRSYLETYDYVIEHIVPYLEGSKYSLRPELSTNSIDWHLHGTLVFRDYVDIVRFYSGLRDLKEYACFCIRDIDMSDPLECIQWYMYCRKQRHQIKPYIVTTYKGKLLYHIYN